MKSVREHLNYTNVVASLALFVALGGGAFAAGAALIGGNGVINGCVLKKGGTLIIVVAGKRCKRGQRPISFNQRGPQGQQGRPQGRCRGSGTDRGYGPDRSARAHGRRDRCGVWHAVGHANQLLFGDRHGDYYDEQQAACYGVGQGEPKLQRHGVLQRHLGALRRRNPGVGERAYAERRCERQHFRLRADHRYDRHAGSRHAHSSPQGRCV